MRIRKRDARLITDASFDLVSDNRSVLYAAIALVVSVVAGGIAGRLLVRIGWLEAQFSGCAGQTGAPVPAAVKRQGRRSSRTTAVPRQTTSPVVE